MHQIPNRRQIIDRKALKTGLDELVAWSGYTPKTQGQVLETLKEAYQHGWNEVRRRFEEDGISGTDAICANAFLVDQVVRVIHEFALTGVYPSANPTTGEQMAVLATGGYGRAELAPFSDVDLMFLLPYKLTAHSEQVVEFTLYTLWDLGLKVGHATRSTEEALRLARDDITIRTSLLEARWLWGNRPLYEEFRARFASELVSGTGPEFVEAKLAERDGRHDRMGDTRYVLEPNIKEGKGGLRDLQTLYWIAKYLYPVNDVTELQSLDVLSADDAKCFAKAENFLWTVRCHLHYVAGRPEERLTFNVQEDLGKRMGYRDHAGSRGVERFMKHYFLNAKDVGDLTRILCAVLEEQQKKSRKPSWLPNLPFRKREIEGFRLDSGRLNVESDKDFKNDPVRLLRLFQLAQKHETDIHPGALREVTRNLKLVNAKLRKNPEANQLFIDMLTGPKPEVTLMRLNEAGVFGRFVPDFGRVVAQMQYDMYHVYTVDEHTIRAIGIVAGIETGRLSGDHPIAHSVITELQSRRTLYVAVLLHDIAKGRGGDHSELGAEVALKLGPRFGLTDWETETVSWLVLHHLAMSDAAFKRDLDDPKAIADFVDLVQSPERLRLLLILTIADIRAVGPNVWNGWKAELLRELYWRALEVMVGGVPAEHRAARAERARTKVCEELAEWTPEEHSAHMERGNDDYWLAADTDTLVRHARLIHEAETNGDAFKIAFEADPERDITEAIIYAPDHPGLFAAIAGAMSLAGASIVDAKIQTLSNGMALDTFWIQDAAGAAYATTTRLSRLSKRIEDCIQGRITPAQELAKAQAEALPSRTRVFKVAPLVLVDNKASNTHTVIEINGRDRAGLLHDVTAAITGQGLQISSAHISTFGERVVDVFYVKDIFGLKMEREDKIERVKQALLEAVSPASSIEPAAASEVDKKKKPPKKKPKPKKKASPTEQPAAE